MARSRPRPRARPRRRRAPEVARQEILEAAERVFRDAHPDQVGLKDVAREAGVSHALIGHYFGTYAGLIEETLERRLAALRHEALIRLQQAGALDRPGELLALLFDALEDPVHLRLTRWLLASERPSAAHALALRGHGLQLIAQQVARAMAKTEAPPRALQDRTEVALLIAVSAAYGYAMAKHALTGAIGREPSRELDTDVRQTLGAMLHAHLRAALAASSSP